MKHVLNIALMAVVILGLAMLEATNWGYAVLAIPAVIWAKSVLNLLHKLPVLAAAFWILVAVFAWLHIPADHEHQFRFNVNTISGPM